MAMIFSGEPLLVEGFSSRIFFENSQLTVNSSVAAEMCCRFLQIFVDLERLAFGVVSKKLQRMSRP